MCELQPLEGGYLPSLRGRLPETNRQKKHLKMNFPKLEAQRTYFLGGKMLVSGSVYVYIYNYLLVEIPGKYSPVK